MAGEVKHPLLTPPDWDKVSDSVRSDLEEGVRVDIEYGSSDNQTECITIVPTGFDKVQNGLGRKVIKATTALPPHLFVRIDFDPFAEDGSFGTVQFTEPAQ